MKTLIVMAVLLSQAALAQTGVSTTVEKGTHLWWTVDKTQSVAEMVVNYGDQESTLDQTIVLDNPEAYLAEAYSSETLQGYELSLISEVTPFNLGDLKYFQVRLRLWEQKLENGQLAVDTNGEPIMEMSGLTAPTRTVGALILKKPKGPKNIGIIRK